MGFFDDLVDNVTDIVLLPVTVPLNIINRIADPGVRMEEKPSAIEKELK